MPTYDAETLRQTALDVRARNASAKRGHPKYTASLTGEQEMILTEGVIDALDALLVATKEVERLRKQLATPLDFGCPTCGATAGQECTYVQGKPRAWWTPTPTSYHAHNRRIDYVDPDVIDDAAIRHAAGVEGKGE